MSAPKGVFVGLCTVDLEYLVDHFPEPNHKIAAPSREMTAGGPAANAAAAFAFCGGRTSLVTLLGRHPLASIARDDLEGLGVNILDCDPGASDPPPVSTILVETSSGDRTAISSNAAGYTKPKYHFDLAWVAGADIVLVDGHHLPLCLEAARNAQSINVPVVLDGGSWKAGTPELLPFIDIAICSEDFLPPGAEHEVTGFLHAQRVPHVAITRGAKPILWSSQGARGEIPVPAVQPKDTTGAGDILHGAFCWAFASGRGMVEALRFASRVASESCLYYGTRSWMKSSEMVRSQQ